MTAFTVKAVQMGSTLVCSHVLAGERPTYSVTLREGLAWHYVRLCDSCSRLSQVPGGLKVRLPKAPEAPQTGTRTALADYIDQFGGPPGHRVGLSPRPDPEPRHLRHGSPG
jgi:hypothetical protein